MLIKRDPSAFEPLIDAQSQHGCPRGGCTHHLICLLGTWPWGCQSYSCQEVFLGLLRNPRFSSFSIAMLPSLCSSWRRYAPHRGSGSLSCKLGSDSEGHLLCPAGVISPCFGRCHGWWKILFGLAKARLKLSQSWSLSLLSNHPPTTTTTHHQELLRHFQASYKANFRYAT